MKKKVDWKTMKTERIKDSDWGVVTAFLQSKKFILDEYLNKNIIHTFTSVVC